MRINEHTKLIGQKVILVPYCKHHVVKYHTWMENEELRRLTASERLSLEDAGKMIASMVGDINIFLNDSIAELTVMIAESEWHRKGLGEEAVRIMLKFAFEIIGLRIFEVKISDDNISSLKLFQKIGFFLTSHCSKFHEYTLSIGVKHILEAISHLEVTVDKYAYNEL
ncbi:acetyltransferase, GNAT family [Onchocerca flexuosa]|uniref:Acetyltransferase, GNAT family n=1 Tax=Onchocerca flexuosa TaxID=387005 RepID=A0A238BY13_9BILA|nr:acetyltransferase, GNAT family [Onchocerca flexuosa]